MIALISSTVLPWVLASSSMSFSSVGTNSWSGGSRKRMFTCLPSSASYSCSKSPAAWAPAWPERPCAAPRCQSRIISREWAAIRSGSKNMLLGAAQADALSAEGHSLLGVAGGVGVGADLQLTILVRQLHDPAKVAALGRGGHSGDGLAVDVAGGAVQGDVVALVVLAASQGEALVGLVHGDGGRSRRRSRVPMPRATTAAWLVMPPRTVRMPWAYCMPSMSSGEVSRRTRTTFSPALPWLHSVLSGKDDLAAGSAGRGSQSGGHGRSLLQGLGVETGDGAERPAAWDPASAGPPARSSCPRRSGRRRSLIAAWGVRLPLRVCSM